MPNKANRRWPSTGFILALTWLFAASLLWSSIRHKGRGLGGSARGAHFEPVRQNGLLYQKALWAGSEVSKQDRAMAALFIRKSIRQKAYLFEKQGCDQARPSIRTRIDARCRREESSKDHARNMKPLEVDAGKQLIIESCVTRSRVGRECVCSRRWASTPELSIQSCHERST
jgi:hypothetical protein